MRKLFFASVAVLALSSAAQAANTSTTVQVGVVNGSSVSQQGLTNDSSSTSQLGIINSATTMQGTSAASLNNGSTVNQVGVQNSATTGQVAFGNNGSSITQNSFGPAPLQNNAAAAEHAELSDGGGVVLERGGPERILGDPAGVVAERHLAGGR